MLLLLLAADTPDRIAIEGEGDIPSFSIERREVSIARFEAFVGQGGYARREHWSAEGWAWVQEHPLGSGVEHRRAGRRPEHPVVAVSWWEAEAYCASQGGMLPTEEQWVLAVCGSPDADALETGPRWPSEQANWYSGSKYGAVHGVDTVSEGPAQGPNQVQNGSGNVWEWTRSEAGDRWKVLKGGSFANLPSYCTCEHREPRAPDSAAYTTGFRCIY